MTTEDLVRTIESLDDDQKHRVAAALGPAVIGLPWRMQVLAANRFRLQIRTARGWITACEDELPEGVPGG
jgi:hypothetical protein